MNEEQVREWAGLVAAFCIADQARRPEGVMRSRSRAKAMLCYDLLTLLDGFTVDLDRLRAMGLVPFNRHELDPIVRGGWDGSHNDHRATDEER